MCKLRYYLSFFLLLQVTVLAADSFNYNPPPEIPKTQYFISLRRNQGRTVGNKYSYSTVEAFSFPFHQDNLWPFLDLRFHHFDKFGKYAANVGLGIRFIPDWTDLILGFNAYYDLRNSHRKHFNQSGLGLEILGRCWSFFLNGYLPFGKRTFLDSFCHHSYPGGYFLLREDFIDSLAGANFEIEALIRRFCWGEIYGALGSYYYRGDKCHGDIYGTEYRLTAWFCNQLTFDINATHDCVYKTRILAQLAFTFPLKEGWKTNPRLYQRVRRHEIVVLNKHSLWSSNF